MSFTPPNGGPKEEPRRTDPRVSVGHDPVPHHRRSTPTPRVREMCPSSSRVRTEEAEVESKILEVSLRFKGVGGLLWLSFSLD